MRYGRDGCQLLEAVRAPDAPAWLRELPAWRRCAGCGCSSTTRDQRGREQVMRREAAERAWRAAGQVRIVSPYDSGRPVLRKTRPGPGAGTRSTSPRPAPGRATAASEPDHQRGHHRSAAARRAMTRAGPRHAHRAAASSPSEHAADAGYACADLLLAAQATGASSCWPRWSPTTSPQARAGGYTAEMFTIDWENQQGHLPPRRASYKWAPRRCSTGKREAFTVAFRAATCRAWFRGHKPDISPQKMTETNEEWGWGRPGLGVGRGWGRPGLGGRRGSAVARCGGRCETVGVTRSWSPARVWGCRRDNRYQCD